MEPCYYQFKILVIEDPYTGSVKLKDTLGKQVLSDTIFY